MKYSYLENTTGTHNKFYEMSENPGGNTWTARYGRIGVTSTEKTYPMRDWRKKYDEKITKGYVDKTASKQATKQKKVAINKEHLEKVTLVLDRLQLQFQHIPNKMYHSSVQSVKNIKDSLSDKKPSLSKNDMLELNKIWDFLEEIDKK